MLEIILEIHKFCCYFLTGLIWVIQLVHYPSFNFAQKDNFSTFMNFHQMRISLIVVPIMILELLLAVFLVYIKSSSLSWINLILLLGIWLSTFILSVPKHANLTGGFSQEMVHSLVNTNWPRTILWSLRSILLIFNSTSHTL